MNDSSRQKRDLSRFAERLDQLRQGLSQRDPLALARNTGSVFQDTRPGSSAFLFSFWERPIALSYPGFVASSQNDGLELPAFQQAAILYYFDTADGAPLQGNWISFSELTDGKFYNQAFQGYTGQELSRAIGSDQSGFAAAAIHLSGIRAEFGSSSFVFHVLPQIPLLVVFWQGDEDFPSSYQVLFDGAAPHYMPTDGYAILGSSLVRRLIDQYKQNN